MKRTLSTIAIFCLAALAQAAGIESRMLQVHPRMTNAANFKRSEGQARAVVLVHGLRLEVDTGELAADLPAWEQTGSRLVEALGKDSDVFAFAYSQNDSVEQITRRSCLVEDVQRLKELGYNDIVLVGHSAGALIVRQLAEDKPDCGVTKVIQVDAPNGGTPLGGFKFLVPGGLQDFVGSLSADARQSFLKTHPAKIPERVQFICVVGNSSGTSDGVLSCRTQWTSDLQEQGIGAVTVALSHTDMLTMADGVKCVCGLVREPQPRWSTGDVVKAKRSILGQ